MKILNNLEHLERYSPQQLTLNGLISVLKALPEGTLVESVTEATSYRGYYDQLALVIQRPATKYTPAAEIVKELEKTKTFTVGFKGGIYIMTDDTPVWVSDWGDISGLAVVGVEIDDDKAHFIVHNTKDEESDDVAHNYL